MRFVQLFLVLIVLVSGCLAASSPYCRTLGKELREAGKDCRCVVIAEPSDELGNNTEDVIPKCRCTCVDDGNVTSIDIVISKPVTP